MRKKSSAIGDVDGALVGGASLKAADFMPIVAAAASAASLEGRGRGGLNGAASLPHSYSLAPTPNPFP